MLDNKHGKRNLVYFGDFNSGSRAWFPTMANSMKKIPSFDSKSDDYETWKKDVQIWSRLTDIEAKKQALAVHLSLSGRARQATSELQIDELENDQGLKRLLSKLDRIFMQDENWKCFNAYLDFENLRKSSDQSVDEFLSEFDLKHYRLKECGVTLPDAIIACRLIKSCNLSEVHFKLCLSTVPKMTFEDMRRTLKKIFSDTKTVDSSWVSQTNWKANNEPVVKLEPEESMVMYSSGYYGKNYGKRFNRRFNNRSSRFRSGRYVDDTRSDTRHNPLGPDGKVSECLVCGSQMHWARSCPHSYENRDVKKYEEVQITLMSMHLGEDKLDLLLSETMGYTLLDTGCSKTVCGRIWLDWFLDTLSYEDRNKLCYSESTSVYKFGNGQKYKALKSVRLACEIVGIKVSIITDVIEAKIPLLMSKSSMKRAKMVIDMNNDEVSVLGKKVKLEMTSLGHYILPLLPVNSSEVLENILLNLDYGNMKNVALKLHKQFGHAPYEKLRKLLMNTEYGNGDLLREIQNTVRDCETCKRFKKPNSKPIVSLPLADRFNEVVAMDLKTWNGNYFLVLVDIFTRYCSAVVIYDKKPDTIITKLFEKWISIFGAPRKFLSDNGGEFNNESFRSLAENFGIRVMCTAAEAPWSNGVCERLNCILEISVHKIKEDVSCNTETALAWAVSARNSLHNYSGFSPNQLVFGNNPVFPSIFEESPAVLEMKTKSKVVADNINAMHSARMEFVRNESSEKIRRALLNNTRNTDVDDVEMGDIVYYKREREDKWRGPGTVIGRDGKQVLVKHGGVYVRVHLCRLQYEKGKKVFLEEEPVKEISVQEKVEEFDFDDDDDISMVEKEVVEKNEGLRERRLRRSDDLGNSNEIHDSPSGRHHLSSFAKGRDRSPIRLGQQEKVYWYPDKNVKDPMIGDRVEIFEKDTNEVNKVTILSRAGKVGGKYGHCFNIKKDDGSVDWIDMSQEVEKWRRVSDDEEVLITCNNEEVFQAKLRELESWKQNNVFEEVENKGQDLISVKWIITEKLKNGEKIIKARLVARGFEENSDKLQCDSPTCSKDALRISLTLISSFNWTCYSLDIKTAYLQGDEIKRNVWLKPPREFGNGKIWKLKKTVYGLNDAARAWYLTVKRVLLHLGLVICKLDPALFFWYKNEMLSGIICIHVDDFIWAGTQEFKVTIMNNLEKHFKVGSTACGQFHYLGVSITQQSDSIMVTQRKYVQEVQEIELESDRAKQRQDELNSEEKQKMQATIGQLNWLSTQTRPDIAFDVCDLCSRINCATVDDILSLNRVIRKLKSRDVNMNFSKLTDLGALSVQCYSDASFGNLVNGGSQGGYILFVCDEENVKNVVSWQSKRIKRVVKSTLSAETMALLEAAEAGVYIATMIAQALNINRPLIKCYVDNKSLCEAVHSSTNVEDKMLRISMAALRDLLQSRVIHSVSWVKSAHQLANVLTKKGVNPSDMLKEMR